MVRRILRGTALLAALGLGAPAGDEFPTRNGGLRITPINHASLMIQAGEQTLHVDPTARGNYQGLPPADIIVITDIHRDHLDPAKVRELSKDGTIIIAPAAVAKSLPNTHVLTNGEKTTVGPWSFEAVPMYNIKRGPAPGKLFHDKGRGNGYVISYGGLRIYIAGDTESTPEMRALTGIDVAFVPMNLPYTMPPVEAAAAVKAFHPKVVYPYHYRGSDLGKFEQALAGTGIEVRIREWYP